MNAPAGYRPSGQQQLAVAVEQADHAIVIIANAEGVALHRRLEALKRVADEATTMRSALIDAANLGGVGLVQDGPT